MGREKIMMSKADPRLLEDLCDILTGENSHTPPLPPSAPSALPPSRSSGPRARRTAFQAQEKQPSRSSSSGPLRPRDVNVQTSAMVRAKERRMSTPTKSTGTRVPERKCTRKVSPQKGGAEVGPAREFSLSKDQQKAIDLVAEGKSVFFTGEWPVTGVLERWRRGIVLVGGIEEGKE